MLGVGEMKKDLIFFVCVLVLGCYREYQDCYEPFFLNETEVDVSLYYGVIDGDEEKLESINIASGDTVYNRPGGTFPFLHKGGLGSFESDLYDVRLVFHATPQKCLTFKDIEFQEHDIRDFSSYENLGICRKCSMRGESEPDGMLYRITEDLLERAEPCD